MTTASLQVQPISVIVLAGGASQRMGTNKALLQLETGETLIAHVVGQLRRLTDDLIVVTNEPQLYADLDARLVGDRVPGLGPLAGLHAGLLAARHGWAFAVACDMPLVDHRLVRYMILLSQGHEVVVPRNQDKLEPLHALYSKTCLPAIEAQLQAGEMRMISFLSFVRVRYVEPREVAIFDSEGRSFFNANSPEDWQALKKLLRRGSDDQSNP